MPTGTRPTSSELAKMTRLLSDPNGEIHRWVVESQPSNADLRERLRQAIPGMVAGLKTVSDVRRECGLPSAAGRKPLAANQSPASRIEAAADRIDSIMPTLEKIARLV